MPLGAGGGAGPADWRQVAHCLSICSVPGALQKSPLKPRTTPPAAHRRRNRGLETRQLTQGGPDSHPGLWAPRPGPAPALSLHSLSPAVPPSHSPALPQSHTPPCGITRPPRQRPHPVSAPRARAQGSPRQAWAGPWFPGLGSPGEFAPTEEGATARLHTNLTRCKVDNDSQQSPHVLLVSSSSAGLLLAAKSFIVPLWSPAQERAAGR